MHLCNDHTGHLSLLWPWSESLVSTVNDQLSLKMSRSQFRYQRIDKFSQSPLPLGHLCILCYHTMITLLSHRNSLFVLYSSVAIQSEPPPVSGPRDPVSDS